MGKVLLINGGARKKGTSARLNIELEQLMRSRGYDVEQLHFIDLYDEKLSQEALLQAIAATDVAGVSWSVHVRTLPADTLEGMHRVYVSKTVLTWCTRRSLSAAAGAL